MNSRESPSVARSEAGGETFWDHLEALRGTLLRCLAAVLVFTVAAFCFRDPLFRVVLYPKPAELQLINTAVTGQFVIHMQVAFCAGLLLSMPYLLYQFFHFLSPALYRQERSLALRLVLSGYALFLAGVAFAYFVVFPFTLRFLGDYQVSESVGNLITLTSYIDTLTVLCLMLGVVFQLPVSCWLLGRFGLITSDTLQRYRRAAVLGIVVVAAVVTPTGDAFTLLIVSLPVYLLYEVSVWVTPR